jgi:hypothetical protein
MWGMLAAASFTTTMFTANRVATIFSAQQFVYASGWCNRFIFDRYTNPPFNFEIFLKWELF